MQIIDTRTGSSLVSVATSGTLIASTSGGTSIIGVQLPVETVPAEPHLHPVDVGQKLDWVAASIDGATLAVGGVAFVKTLHPFRTLRCL